MTATEHEPGEVLAEMRLRGEWRASGLPVNANPQVLSSSYLAAGAGSRLLGFTAYNSDSSSTYVQIFDSPTLPANGAVPIMVWQVPANGTLAVNWVSTDWLPQGRLFQRGMFIVNSSTDTTKTLGSAKLLLDVQYV